ncbi:MAG: PBP1A family penicillin-binding protein, partial [Atribacterota bacterium]
MKRIGLSTSVGMMFLLGMICGAVFFVVFGFFFLSDFKEISSRIDNFQPSFTSRIYDYKGRLIDELFTENREYVPLSDIPDVLRKVFIASEDQNFYSHPGIDLVGILRAAYQDLLNLKIVEGASTITQQLARNRFLSQKRIFNRKIKEILLALLIEKKYTKDEILEAYLNQIYFGHGAYGVKTAARIYFDKDLSHLNLAETAMLAGILRSPGNFSPYVNLRAAKVQQKRALRRMKEIGFITPEEMDKVLETPIVLSGLKKIASEAPYFVDYVLKDLLNQFDEEMVFSGGLKVFTTLDLDVQEIANKTLKESGYQGAILCLDPKNGNILAMVGGRDYQESKFNRAYQALRQPGSTFKPFVYTTAIDGGISPVDIFVDEPLVFPNNWKPKNYDKKFRGPMTLHEALEQSINIVGIKVLQQVGIDKAMSYAQRMGIHSPLQGNLSLVLGTSEVTLLELADAYSAFANGGRVPEPLAILKIEDSSGQVLFYGKRKVKQI